MNIVVNGFICRGGGRLRFEANREFDVNVAVVAPRRMKDGDDRPASAMRNIDR